MRTIPQRRLWALSIVAALVLIGPSGKARQGNTQEPIKIGVFLDLSGQTSSFGQSTLNGIRLAADEINAAGGLTGRRVDLTVEDDQGEPGKAATAVERLVHDKRVHALVGEVASSNTVAAAPIAQEARVPLLSPASTHPRVTMIGDYIFRACFVDPLQGDALAQFATRDLKAKRAASLTDSYSDYSKSITSAFEKRFAELGGKVVVKHVYAQRDRDFMSQLVSIKTRRPDVILASGYYQEVATIIKQARQIGIRTPFLGGDGWDAPQLWDLGGRSLNGSYISNHYSSDIPTTANKLFVAAYQRRYGAEPDALAALGYDSMKMLAEAIRRAGTTDGPALRDALARTKNLDGVTGSITLNEHRNAIKPVYIFRLRDGKFLYRTSVGPSQ